MLRVLQLSDLHFSNQRLDEKVRCMTTIMEAAGRIEPDVAAVVGDLFDHALRLEDPGAREAIRFMSELADYCPVIFIKGNHSHDRNSVEILRWVGGKHPFYVSTVPSLVYLIDNEWRQQPLDLPSPFAPDAPQAAFFTLPYPSPSTIAQRVTLAPLAMQQAASDEISQMTVETFGRYDTGNAPRILLFHGVVGGALMDETQHAMGIDIELSRAAIARGRFDLVCCGHLHHKQCIGRRAFYTGGLCYGAYGETGERGAWLHTLEDVGDLDGRDALGVHVADPAGEGDQHRHDVHTGFVPSSGILCDLQSHFISSEPAPMRVFQFDATAMEDWTTPVPDWHEEPCELKIIVKVRENDEQPDLRTEAYWRNLFPNARLKIERQVQPLRSVRNEAVRTARTLREKLVVYGEGAGLPLSESVLAKATLLESQPPGELLAALEKEVGDVE